MVAATAGIAVGPLFAVPLARRYGRTCVFFWSMVGLLVTGVWSATMTHSNQYPAFIAARLFGGLFGGVAPSLGADTIVDLFFLHQRGKAFTALNLSFLAGVVVGPTLSGFIVDSKSWTVQFWWSNGVEAMIIILTLALLEDTYYDRSLKTEEYRKSPPENFVENRVATFFCGSRVIKPISNAETVSCCRRSPLVLSSTAFSQIRFLHFSVGINSDKKLTGALSSESSATPSSSVSVLLHYCAVV